MLEASEESRPVPHISFSKHSSDRHVDLSLPSLGKGQMICLFAVWEEALCYLI